MKIIILFKPNLFCLMKVECRADNRPLMLDSVKANVIFHI